MKEIKLSRKEVEQSIRGSLAEDIFHDDITFNVDEKDIIELTPDMEVNKNPNNETELSETKHNPFSDNTQTHNIDISKIEEKVERDIHNWLNKNLSQIVQKAIKEEFEKSE